VAVIIWKLPDGFIALMRRKPPLSVLEQVRVLTRVYMQRNVSIAVASVRSESQ
jgi:hypothetical protein